MRALDRTEHAVRRWHEAMRGRYGHDSNPADLMSESGALLQAWRDIDHLIRQLDTMQALVREMEQASDPQKDTDLMSAVPRSVPTSDDTIEIQWPLPPALPLPSVPSPALTPVRAVPAVSLPTDPPSDVRMMSPQELWNAVVDICESRAESEFSRCLVAKLNIYDIKRRIIAIIHSCRRNVSIEPLDDEGHCR